MSNLLTGPSLLTHLSSDLAFLEIWNQIPQHIRLEFPPDTLMSPRVLVARLDESGIPIAFGTLERLRSVGGGPVFTKFGRVVLYRWGDALLWALNKLQPLRASTSDAEFEDAASNLSTPTPWSMPAKRPITSKRARSTAKLQCTTGVPPDPRDLPQRRSLPAKRLRTTTARDDDQRSVDA